MKRMLTIVTVLLGACGADGESNKNPNTIWNCTLEMACDGVEQTETEPGCGTLETIEEDEATALAACEAELGAICVDHSCAVECVATATSCTP